MSDFIHGREHLGDNDGVVVESDTQCNVLLLDDTQFAHYQAGRDFSYYGGNFKSFPARLAPPHAGWWNVVLDLGGGAATIRYSIRVVRS